MKNTSNPKATTTQAVLPIPFTLEQLREDILNIYLLQLRTMYLFANDQQIWALAGKSGIREGHIWDGALAPKDFSLTYEEIQDTILAKVLEQQYSFGFFGIDNNLCEPMHMDTMHTWVAAYLRDLKSSAVVGEWEANGADIDVSRCIYTCELANARNVLEGGENFYPYMKDDENKEEEALTVRQMALLSGMEEMTIRTAISRKSAHQLQAHKDDRRTLISIKEAKAWLTEKGRYVPITRQSLAGANLNLEKTGFLSIYGFSHAMAQRVTYLDEHHPEAHVIQQLGEMNMKGIYFKHRDDLLSSKLMTKAAKILQLPAQLLVLRAKEAVLQEDLAQTAEAVEQARAQLHSA